MRIRKNRIKLYSENSAATPIIDQRSFSFARFLYSPFLNKKTAIFQKKKSSNNAIARGIIAVIKNELSLSAILNSVGCPKVTSVLATKNKRLEENPTMIGYL